MAAIEPKRNVYVGHRYVPLILGEWDQTETYEGLTIVTNQGSSYTSKKRVPVGIPISNEEYWVITGNYNAQIDQYRQDVNNYKEDINTFKEDFTDQLADIVVSVKNYGATGDGVTDDAPSIRLAIDAIRQQGGGTLYFPIGTYLLKTHDPLTANPLVNFWINFSNLTIQGESKGNVILKPNNGTLRESIFGNFYTNSMANIKIDNITFDFNGENNFATSGSRSSKAAFFTYWCDGLEISNCRFLNASGEHCVYVGGADSQENGKNIRIHDNEFYNVGDSVAGNIHNADHSSIFATGRNIWIYNNSFINPNKSMRATAIEAEGINVYQYANYIEKYNLPFLTANLTGAWTSANGTTTKNILVDNVHIYSNVAKECLDGWWVENHTVGGFKNVKFYNNIIELSDSVVNGTRYCIKGEGTVSKAIENVEIHDNTFTTNTDYALNQGTALGIGIDVSKNISIKNNKFFNLAGFAIRLRSTSLGVSVSSSDLIVEGNKLINVCANSSEGFNKAIIIIGNIDRLKIENNEIDNVAFTGCQIGVQLYAGNPTSLAYKNVSIKGNRINVALTDIESWTLNMATSENILINHHSFNTNFDILNQVQATNRSTIVFPNTDTKYIKSGVWQKLDKGTAPPTTGQRYKNDYRENTTKSESGTVGSKYLIKGWECTVTGNPGTWVQDRTLTGG